MAAYSEEEQVEMIRKWWSENGTALIITIALAVAAILGWRYYKDSNQAEAGEASQLYQEMMASVEAARQRPDSVVDAERAEGRANSLVQLYPDSSYADFARLLLARMAVEKQDLDGARNLLAAVDTDPATEAQGWVARLRLARLALMQDDADAALAVVNRSFPEAFLGEALELKGDALRLKGDVEGARAAYQAALEALTADTARTLVQMKLDDLVPAS